MNEQTLAVVLKELLEKKTVEKEYNDEEKLRAAYALNMCMVSISQIIDYDDMVILEQEYEAILNNLNLEMMPKDEALLKIIKQILDTITFFRIQEGDKEIIEREYQQKTKNAIWSAVPNFGLIISGGSVAGMAISLASQVGIGYMNYRRAKSENALNYDKQIWQLQRSAIEQFNGLRRELFDTAWRLADTYKFPDKYRLTERQISQYNEILMDSDEIRKYERMTTVKENFVAYPPFWYHYGSTANHIARNYELSLSDDSRDNYKNEARTSFEQFWKSNKFTLLREDMLASACALEHIDLLDPKADRERIGELINKAVASSGNANDILQLCAMAYLRIDEKISAARLLRILVNENYNKVVNAQLLSAIYVFAIIIGEDSQKNRADYELLSTRVDSECLYRLPDKEYYHMDSLEEEFIDRQEDILLNKYDYTVTEYVSKLEIKFAKIIPSIDEKRVKPDSYYSVERIGERVQEYKSIYYDKNKSKILNDYILRVLHCDYFEKFFDLLNVAFDDLAELEGIRDWQVLSAIIEKSIADQSQMLTKIQKNMDNSFIDVDDYFNLLILPPMVLKEFVSELKNQIKMSFLGRSNMAELARADSVVQEFCNRHDISEYDAKDSNTNNVFSVGRKRFSFELLGDEGKSFYRKQERNKRVEEIIRNHVEDIKTISEKSDVYFRDTSSTDFNSYMSKCRSKDKIHICQDVVAVFDDKTRHNVDIMFTVDAIVPVIRGSIKTPIPYLYIGSGKNESKNIKASDMINGYMVLGILTNGLSSLAMYGLAAHDARSVERIIQHLQKMIDEIFDVYINEIQECL